MHIVYLIERIDKEGGIQRSLTVRVNYLIEKYKYKITIVCTEKDSGIPAYRIDDSVNFVFLEKLTSKKTTVGRIYLRFSQSQKILNTLKPDIIISVKYTLHNVFFRFIPHHAMLISEIREPLEQYNENVSISFKSIINHKMRDYILRRQDVMIVLTEADKKSWGFKNIKVVPNPKTIHSDTVSKLNNKQVLAIGRLHKVKGFEKLLDVWNIVSKRHPDWILKICGEGEEYLTLFSKAKTLGLSNSVMFTNKFMPVIPAFLESSIFVLTSQFEAFGNVMVESKICGVPIVAFDAPNGPREIIIDGKDGYVVELNNIEEMAERIIFLIENPEIRLEMGAYAKKDSERYDEIKIVELYNNILVQCVKGRNE